MTAPTTIDIAGLDKGKVVAALYNGSKPAAAFFDRETLDDDIDTAPVRKVMTAAEGQAHFDATGGMLPKYLDGRYVGNADVSGDTLDVRSYDRDLGVGAAARALQVVQREAALQIDRSHCGRLSF